MVRSALPCVNLPEQCAVLLLPGAAVNEVPHAVAPGAASMVRSVSMGGFVVHPTPYLAMDGVRPHRHTIY